MIIVPPEWAPQTAIWTAWPQEELWPGVCDAVRREVGAMIRALAEGEQIKVLAMPGETEASARMALDDIVNAEIISAPYGDIWLRDTGPIFAREDGKSVALIFRLNGWGGKYLYPHDDDVSMFIATRSGTPNTQHDFVLEGGGVEFDGAGRLLTTRSCLLNPNRNPHFSPVDVETRLRTVFDVSEIIWLDEGLLLDHTDGHIDNIARFAGGNRVLCQVPSGADDPNAVVLKAIQEELRRHRLDIVTIPSPGRIAYPTGEVAPASHMNYVIGNKAVVVPVYEDKYSAEAVDILSEVFPGRKIVPLPAANLLTGGGSFHCITQQEPLG
jgi:agmatine deiminase